MILAGDIGGTKSNLALFAQDKGKLTPVAEEKFLSREHSGLEHIVEKFLSSRADVLKGQTLTAAAFGIAGPVVGDTVKTPNLPWVISAKVIRKTVGVEKVQLINDLESNGYGIPLLLESEFVTLNEGIRQPHAHGALISAGTGLGEAFLYRDGDNFIPVASEGGHTDFAPQDELEIELLLYLMNKWDHVSFERVLSGPGLFNIYCFFRDTGRGEEPAWLTEKIQQGDPAVAVTQAALAEECDLCIKALNLFVAFYGAEAGNLALKCKALGGVYIGGGIAPALIEQLKDGTFMRAFRNKGRLSSMLEAIPVRVILNPKTALFGAGRYASLL
ncbi:glucokinase [Acidobacteria bacterium AH-259-D05]|nr:glucokinase [Acidobacteria bacterium AH-259-D05]